MIYGFQKNNHPKYIGIDDLGNLQTLETLCCQVPYIGINNFVDVFQNLKNLDICNDDVKDENLIGLKNITRLYCDDCKLLSDLNHIENLEVLSAERTNIKYNSISQLKKLRKILTDDLELEKKINKNNNEDCDVEELEFGDNGEIYNIFVCNICYSNIPKEKSIVLPCNHKLCEKCFVDMMKSECPYCRKAFF
jgi:hypothetical protein